MSAGANKTFASADFYAKKESDDLGGGHRSLGEFGKKFWKTFLGVSMNYDTTAQDVFPYPRPGLDGCSAFRAAGPND